MKTRIAVAGAVAAGAVGLAGWAGAAPSPSAEAAPAAAVLTSEAGTPTGPLPEVPEATANPLRILLTNDDGWDAEGIRGVYAALTRVGHDVTVVAPATKQSGKGGAVTYSGSLDIDHPDTSAFPEYGGTDITTVGPGPNGQGGTPADTVAFALAEVFGPGDAPDLVVSGTNMGQNTSLVVNHSGTMGAAISGLAADIPSIAISAEKSSDYEPSRPGPTDYAGAGEFLAGFIERIAPEIARSEDLPGDIGFNINYPMSEPKGVKVVDFDDIDPFEVTYEEVGETGEFVISDRSIGDRKDLRVDTGAIYQGWIAITAVDPYYSLESRWIDRIVARPGAR